jgi:hypothetical protein
VGADEVPCFKDSVRTRAYTSVSVILSYGQLLGVWCYAFTVHDKALVRTLEAKMDQD